jgi:transaldolase
VSQWQEQNSSTTVLIFEQNARTFKGYRQTTGDTMNATQRLHDLGQSLWLDNITRELLTGGTLNRYISEFSVTGLTSNPTIFDHAIADGNFYDDAIRIKSDEGRSGEALFFELALEDLTEAADLFRPTHDATAGLDGWVSLEVSPLLANDTAGTIKAAAHLHARARRPNLFIKIPGTRAGIAVIEETIFAGVPVNVTLLSFADHGKVADIRPPDENYAEAVISEFNREGINDEALADDLQRQGTEAFAKSWKDMMSRLASKSTVLAKADSQ